MIDVGCKGLVPSILLPPLVILRSLWLHHEWNFFPLLIHACPHFLLLISLPPHLLRVRSAKCCLLTGRRNWISLEFQTPGTTISITSWVTQSRLDHGRSPVRHLMTTIGIQVLGIDHVLRLSSIDASSRLKRMTVSYNRGLVFFVFSRSFLAFSGHF